MNTNNTEEKNRNKTIIRTSIIGILVNVLLAAFKAVVGIISNSIAIVLDAVNNISDAASSVITIAGTALAAKQPDKKHPFGYGRIEYLSALVISMIILYAGITSLIESVKKIIDPSIPDYGTASLIIVAVGVAVKVVLGRYVKGIGKKVNSDSLINSGADATLDSVISASTLAAAIIYIASGFSTEAYLGAIISVIIIKSGLDMIKETLSRILGESAEPSLVVDIKNTVKEFEDVRGVYDLVLNNYGPDMFNGSLHIEVPENYPVGKLDELSRKITYKVYEKYNIYLTAIGVYAFNEGNTKAVSIHNKIASEILSIKYVRQMHGFYYDEEAKSIRFDAVISFDSPDRSETYKQVCDKVMELYPDHKIVIAMDADFSELD
ncbi:MAG: cation diffusion facilitator family transporter [Lachnospiraceae bacterium]|nr:cation diffusion facilitator family transporter [Lachnospiraceae bacterium]